MSVGVFRSSLPKYRYIRTATALYCTAHQPRKSKLTTRPSREPIMGSFILPNSKPRCLVSVPDGLNKDKIMSFIPFHEWASRFQRSLDQQSSEDHPFHNAPYRLRSITVQSWDMFGPRIGFMKIQADISNDKGEKLPGAVFLRGASVAMMVRMPLSHEKYRG